MVLHDLNLPWAINEIRQAIWQQKLSFPSQVPVFVHLHRPDIHWRIALLYFVRGWPVPRIAARYGLNRKRISQLLRQWTGRAIQLGYIEEIPSEAPVPEGSGLPVTS